MSKEYNAYLEDHISTVRMCKNWIMTHVGEKKVLDILPELNIDDNTATGFKMLQFVFDGHDASKYYPNEYAAYDGYFYGPNGIKKAGGPSAEVKTAFDLAWLRHIHQNPHHWQHWVLVNDDPDEGVRALEMMDIYILEMVCDWWSFSWREGNLYEIFSWWTEHNGYIKLGERTKIKVVALLDAINEALIAEEDEKETGSKE